MHVEDEGPVRVVVIDRPQSRGAVDGQHAAALLSAFEELEQRDDLSVGVLTGAGGHFCSGADLKAVAAGSMPVRGYGEGPGPMGPTRLRLSKPVVAGIEGYAVAGGLELALWCDLRVVAESAVLGVFCRRWGVPLVDGGTQRLPRVVGLGRALDMILSGRMVPVEEAHAMGLVNEVVPAGKHLERALEYAEALAAFPQETMLADREAAIRGIGLPFEDGLALEAQSSERTLEVAWKGAARFAGGEGRGGAGAGA